MRFLLDESSGKRLARLLSAAGHDVVYVGDVMPSAPDEDVIAKAESEGRILISDDKDFGELATRLRKPASGVILLRTATTDTNKRAETLIETLRDIDATGKLLIVKEGRMRVIQL